MAIDVTFPDLDFPHRGEFERSEFVNKQEAAQDVLAAGWNTAYNTFKTQANALETNVNNKEANVVAKHDIVVAKEALMSPHYDNIDIVAENIDTIGSKIGAVDIHNATSKATPIDNDELAILDSATTFSLKKLTFANLKDTLKTIPTISTGTATFTATTNNINLTGIGIGVEIGDVIQISGADDAKNNSEFTIEVITDADNIIVNQAHANKGTSKNVADRSGDTGVTVKLLAKWYNAPIGLGQAWVNVTSSRIKNTNYSSLSHRSMDVSVQKSDTNTQVGYIVIDGLQVCKHTTANQTVNLNTTVPINSVYSYSTISSVEAEFWMELR